MTKKTTKAYVTGKNKKRTALGMMVAYLAMYPATTLECLKATFTKASTCPDSGIKEVFYTESELEEEKSRGTKWFNDGIGYFAKEEEWLTLGDGTKIAFNAMWTADSLEMLKNEMSKYGIVGAVLTGLPVDYEIRLVFC